MIKNKTYFDIKNKRKLLVVIGIQGIKLVKDIAQW